MPITKDYLEGTLYTLKRQFLKFSYLCTMQSWKRIFLIFAVIFIADLAFGQGCSQCKLVAEQGSALDEASFGSNINYGIIFLMAFPYIILGTAALAIVYRKRLARLFKKS